MPKQGPSDQEAVTAHNGTRMDISRHKARKIRSQLGGLDLERKGKDPHKEYESTQEIAGVAW